MKVIRKRLGFANNSSSTHSIVMLRDPSTVSECGQDCDFGWENFTLKSEHDKLSYLTAMIQTNDYNKEDVEEFGLSEYWMDTYIDHESVWTIPKEFGSNKPCKIFTKALVRYFMDDKTVVFGGNDNSEGHPDYNKLESIDKINELGFRDIGRNVICKQISDDVFVFFNTNHGNKTAYSFDGRVVDYTPSTPELIDVKITQYCNVKDICSFCTIPGSKVDGKKIENIKIGDKVWSFNREKNLTELAKVEEVFEREYEGEMIEIETEKGGVINLTPNHEVYTSRGWVEAKHLTIDDKLLDLNKTKFGLMKV